MQKTWHFSGVILVSGFIGFVLYRVLMHIDTPVGNTLPDMVVTVILCVIVEKVAEAVKKKTKRFPSSRMGTEERTK